MDLRCQHCGQQIYEIEIGAGHVDYSTPDAVTPANPDGLGCPESPEGPHQGPHEPQESDVNEKHLCPSCKTPTQYQVFSGGREWYCPGCGMDGMYRSDDEKPPRVALLGKPDGLDELRRQMFDHFNDA